MNMQDLRDMASGVRGTLNYMAPELLSGSKPQNSELHSATDVWAAGVILFTLATGLQPFVGAQ